MHYNMLHYTALYYAALHGTKICFTRSVKIITIFSHPVSQLQGPGTTKQLEFK